MEGASSVFPSGKLLKPITVENGFALTTAIYLG